jgi:NAD(P)-dependent dehydrogenase (short-subunit alcohol dehydrogenase family)
VTGSGRGIGQQVALGLAREVVNGVGERTVASHCLHPAVGIQF